VYAVAWHPSCWGRAAAEEGGSFGDQTDARQENILASGSIEPYAIACDCRKPMPGMVLRAAREWDLDLSRSFIVGDKPSDIDAGVAAGVPVRYFVGHPGVERPIEATGVVTGLLDCARHVLANETAVSA
jgi:histidinol phosphatase-like enzyme